MRVVFFGGRSSYSRLHLEALSQVSDVCAVIEDAECTNEAHHCVPPNLVGPMGLLRRRLLHNSSWLWGEDRGIESSMWCRHNQDDLLLKLKALEPDLGVIASFSTLLPSRVLAIPRFGFINVHGSLLPQFPGPNPNFWHYLTCAKQGGLSIHKVTEKEDAGEVIAQKVIPIPLGLPISDYLAQLREEGPLLLAKVIQSADFSAPQAIVDRSEEPVVRARRVGPREHVVDWSKSIHHVAHMLEGALAYGVLHGLDPKYSWQVNRISLRSNPAQEGSIGKSGSDYYFNHRDGAILLVRGRPWRRILGSYARQLVS